MDNKMQQAALFHGRFGATMTDEDHMYFTPLICNGGRIDLGHPVVLARLKEAIAQGKATQALYGAVERYLKIKAKPPRRKNALLGYKKKFAEFMKTGCIADPRMKRKGS